MYEIEAKVPISKRDFQRLKIEIPKMAKKRSSIINRDSYYSESKKSTLRLRSNNIGNFLHIKSKKRGEGIEENQEIEIPINSISKFDSFLNKIGIELFIRKEKRGEIYKKGAFQIELNYIKKLGYFLEIETVVKSKNQIPKAKISLLALFNKLGFKPGDFEKKYYLELLNK